MIDKTKKKCHDLSDVYKIPVQGECVVRTDAEIEESLKIHLCNLGLPDVAVSWLLMLWKVTQVFDDVADNHLVKRDALDKAIYFSLVEMNINPFYRSYINELSPVVANCILKWQASDRAERDGKADARSYMWRAAYYDVVMMVVLIVHGFEKAKALSVQVMNLYGESFDDYKKEFHCG